VFLQCKITQRIDWFKGEASDGAIWYAPAAGFTVASFARDVLGNVYAQVETVTGYGIRISATSSLHGTGWAVVDTWTEARTCLKAIAVVDDEDHDTG
jgi:hypothetical protein